MIDAKTIQIFLPDGQPRGLRIAEITTRIVQAIQVPRTRLQQFCGRRESEQIGLYFLFGERGEAAKPLAYIGQTEDLQARLKKHHADKEFWKTAVVVVSKTQSFTQAHIRYLEWLSISEAASTSRYSLDNANAGSKPFVPEPMEADVLDAFETAATLLATLGFPVFEPLGGPAVADSAADVYMVKGPNAHARGRPVEDGFIVLADSIARRNIVPSANDWVRHHQQRLIAGGVLVDGNDPSSLVFREDYVFDAPSGAAAVVLGRNSNGWQDWRRASDGKSLHEVVRVADEDSSCGVADRAC